MDHGEVGAVGTSVAMETCVAVSIGGSVGVSEGGMITGVSLGVKVGITIMGMVAVGTITIVRGT
jgi:hypothetical protein